jgi:hypothetical protein
MCAPAGGITCTVLVPGVVRFAWHDSEGRGDGLLVDVGVATPTWRAVADVLVRPFGTAQFSGTEEPVVLAEAAQRADGSFVVHLGHTRMTAADWSMVLTVLVGRYRTVVGAGITCCSEHPPGSA